ncbi:lactonase family protein [Paenibacillus allorhizosphaerae]|uniref:6-phosphogluconolactonase n=1 Tax=Paenibacillus allorhizosphaerae TaxID=2849866 RepID=A0ABN7THE6_9BACL|nr:lactonase family protein [Paenibacillus allorhizosphaerae]CAG7624703.1 6-phosphogluconolactonase [Paenibacillus allorhizosphaerae]
MRHDEKGSYLLFAGSYAEASEDGLYAYTLDRTSGALTLLNRSGGYRNPCFLDIDHRNRMLYTVAERTAAGEEPCAIALAFSFDPASGHLQLLNEEKTVGRATCHIQYNAAGRYVVATSFSGGAIGYLPVLPDGQLGCMGDAHRHEGAGPHPTRQDRPHPHSAYTDPENRYVYVPDLGIDRVKIYRPDPVSGKLEPHGEAIAPPGSGPRHMAFHPSKPYAYVINELDSTISAYERDAASGALRLIDSVTTLPPEYEDREANTCAEIQITPDGRFVYGSNRGHDSIAAFRVEDRTGRLSPVQIVSSMGRRPRNFAVSPDGRYLVAAHQDSANLVVFRIDEQTGMLLDTGHRAEASKAVCVRFWEEEGQAAM